MGSNAFFQSPSSSVGEPVLPVVHNKIARLGEGQFLQDCNRILQPQRGQGRTRCEQICKNTCHANTTTPKHPNTFESQASQKQSFEQHMFPSGILMREGGSDDLLTASALDPASNPEGPTKTQESPAKVCTRSSSCSLAMWPSFHATTEICAPIA